MIDWKNLIIEIEERLFPYYEFDVWHRSMYYFLLSQTHALEIESAILPLGQISNALKCSDFKSREVIRSLDKMGCIKLEQTRKGHQVEVLLPSDLNLPTGNNEETVIDIERIDFFKNRKHLASLLEREGNKCFYCLKEIDANSCELDHITSQLSGGDNSYKNIVASCHKCNTTKVDKSANDHIRNLYRKDLLSEEEFEKRVDALESLALGKLQPKI